MNQSVARIFISSTFRDFGEERDLLVRQVFPALREKLRERFVELVDVDLRWGITAEQSERGEVLPICLAEIDRARPWFVGMLGDRYGWVPPADHYDEAIVDQRPWLAEHQGGKSVTELEILHGVLNDPAMAGRAFFYFRDPAYASTNGEDYISASPEDAQRLSDLKDRIRKSGFPVVEAYPDPQALAQQLEADLWAALDEAFPAEEIPDAFEREQRLHAAYAAPRRQLYLGAEHYLTQLDEAMAQGSQRILVTGQSGGGKSALLANWLERYRTAQPAHQVHAYFLGAGSDATNPLHLVRQLIEHIRRGTGSQDEIADDPQVLLDSLPAWLAQASAHAARHDTRWLIALDGLNNLADLRDLRWFPSFLPDRIHVAISCLPGDVETALRSKGDWHEIAVAALTDASSRDLLRAYLAIYNKTLPDDLEDRVIEHPLSGIPLFLRTLAEELRLFGNHDALSQQLDLYLTSATIDDLFERVLARIERDCGAKAVRTAMVSLWASRAGLTEQELLAYVGLPRATWAAIRYGLGTALLESGDRITFGHDYMRIAVSDRYLAGNGAIEGEGQSPLASRRRAKAHADLAKWFEARAFGANGDDGISISDARAIKEIPYQWQAAQRWGKLKAFLTRHDAFKAFGEHSDEYDLLGYWLQVEAHTKVRLENAYRAAWARWKKQLNLEQRGAVSSAISEFLETAGRLSGGFAFRMAEEALTIAERTLGPNHIMTATNLNNLAVLFKAKADFAAAEPFFRRALAITEKAFGSEHSLVGQRLNNLAQLQEERGDYEEAEILYRRALAIAEKTLGPSHPDTGIHLNNLASLLHAKADYSAAEPLLRRALAIAEHTLGLDHPYTGMRLNNLAALFQAKDDLKSAEPLYRRALTIAEKAQGPDHPATGTRLNNLAGLLETKGDLAAAEPLYRRALAIAEKAQGPDHPSTGTSLNNLAMLLETMGDLAAAEPLYRRALAIDEQVLGPPHPDTQVTLDNLAGLLEAKGDLAAAEPLRRRALTIAGSAMAGLSTGVARQTNNLGVLLRNLGRHEEALSMLMEARGKWDTLGDELGKASTLSALGKLWADKEDAVKARAEYEACLAIRERLLPEDDPSIALVRSRLTELD